MERYEENLRHIMDVKRRSIVGPDTFEGRTKLFRFAVSRGFEPELIKNLSDCHFFNLAALASYEYAVCRFGHSYTLKIVVLNRSIFRAANGYVGYRGLHARRQFYLGCKYTPARWRGTVITS